MKQGSTSPDQGSLIFYSDNELIKKHAFFADVT
jgi:hypothetical protein